MAVSRMVLIKEEKGWFAELAAFLTASYSSAVHRNVTQDLEAFVRPLRKGCAIARQVYASDRFRV